MAEKERIIMVQKGKIEDMDRSFDIKFWQAQDPSARFEAAWELVLHYHIDVLGKSEDELRLQRTIASFQRQEG